MTPPRSQQRSQKCWWTHLLLRETLKMEDVAVPFGTYKAARAAKVFPYLPYFDLYKFVYKEWGQSKQPFVGGMV